MSNPDVRTFTVTLDHPTALYFEQRCKEMGIEYSFAIRESLTHAGMIPRRTKDLKVRGAMTTTFSPKRPRIKS